MTPSIDITQEQADDLARGKSVVIDPPFSQRYIVVFDNGNVYDTTTDEPLEEGKQSFIDLVSVDCKLIAKGPHPQSVGHVQCGAAGPGTVVKLTEMRF